MSVTARFVRPNRLVALLAGRHATSLRWQSTNTSKDFDRTSMDTPLPSPTEIPTLLEKTDKSFFGRMYDKYSFKQQTNRILVAESFLQAATRQASDPRWFGPGRISKDFRSVQALVTMHVWFLHKRLTSDGKDPHMAALIQEELFDILWTDTTCRMRSHGVNEWVIGKNLKTVQQYTFMHCFHYDHCYTELLDKPEERFDELKDLVMAHILLLSPDDEKAHALHNDQAERIAWYIEAQYQNIGHDLPETSYRKGRVAWVDLPDFSDLQDGKGNILEELPIDPNDVLPDAWVTNVANDGTYYYWNLNTREATWDRP